MSSERHGELVLDRCDRCKGLWFDGTELDGYLAGRRGSVAPPPDRLERLPNAGQLTCPRCRSSTLVAFRLEGAYLSRCSGCGGVYLDGADVLALEGRRPIYKVPPANRSGLPSRTGELVAGTAAEGVVQTAVEFVIRAVIP